MMEFAYFGGEFRARLEAALRISLFFNYRWRVKGDG
jgi:hypothetical protein